MSPVLSQSLSNFSWKFSEFLKKSLNTVGPLTQISPVYGSSLVKKFIPFKSLSLIFKLKIGPPTYWLFGSPRKLIVVENAVSV